MKKNYIIADGLHIYIYIYLPLFFEKKLSLAGLNRFQRDGRGAKLSQEDWARKMGRQGFFSQPFMESYEHQDEPLAFVHHIVLGDFFWLPCFPRCTFFFLFNLLSVFLKKSTFLFLFDL